MISKSVQRAKMEKDIRKDVLFRFRCELVMLDLENAPAFSRVLRWYNLRQAPARRKTKVRIFLPQPVETAGL